MDVKIICAEDCGNAPKKRIIRDLIEASAKKDWDVIKQYCREDIQWTIVNDKQIQGIEELIKVVEEDKDITEVEIFNIITHGHTASSNGVVKYKDSSTTAFCHVYRFVSPGKNVLKEITSYIIELNT